MTAGQRCRRGGRHVRDQAEQLGAPIRARIASWAYCGVEPKNMGIGPVPAIRMALQRAGKTLDDVDVIELNEALAAQGLAVIQELELYTARETPTAVRSRSATRSARPARSWWPRSCPKWSAKIKLGLVSLCIGGGQRIALLLARD